MTRMCSKFAPDGSAAGLSPPSGTAGNRAANELVGSRLEPVVYDAVQRDGERATHLPTPKSGIGRNGCVPLKQPVALSFHLCG